MNTNFIQIISLFTTRELANGTWIFIILICLFINREIRISIKNVLKCLFIPIFVGIYLILTVYFLIITFILYKFDFWNLSLIKDSIFWFLLSGLTLCMQSNNKENYFTSIKNIFMDNIKATVLLEYVINTYTFNFGIELLIVPIISILVMLNIFSTTQEKYKPVKFLTDNILIFIGILMFSYFSYELYLHFNKIATIDSLRQILLPIIYTTFFIVPATLLKIYSEYESAFGILACCCKGYDQKNTKHLVLKLLILCKFNFKRLKNIVQYATCSDENLNTKENVASFLNLYLKREQLLPFNSFCNGFNPREAILYLSEEDLKPDNYRYNGYDDGFGEYYDISTKSLELTDTLEYSIEGNNQSVQKLQLEFNEFIFNGENNENYNYFLNYAKKLYNNALKIEMPHEIFSVLKNRKSKKYIIDNYQVIIEKEKYPNNINLTNYRFIIQIT